MSVDPYTVSRVSLGMSPGFFKSNLSSTKRFEKSACYFRIKRRAIAGSDLSDIIEESKKDFPFLSENGKLPKPYSFVPKFGENKKTQTDMRVFAYNAGKSLALDRLRYFAAGVAVGSGGLGVICGEESVGVLGVGLSILTYVAAREVVRRRLNSKILEKVEKIRRYVKNS